MLEHLSSWVETFLNPTLEVHLVTMIFLSVYLAGGVLRSIRNFGKHQEYFTEGKLPKREENQFSQGFLKGHLYLLLYLFFAVYLDKASLSDFGFKTNVSVSLSVVVGLLAYITFILIYDRVIKKLGMYNSMVVSSYLTHRKIIPRSKRGKKQLFVGLMLNPFSEEFIYRGFLIFYLGELIEFHPLMIAIGLIVCVLIHTYQDLKNIYFHAGFCAISIFLLYSEFGLIACVSFHVLGDLYPAFQFKRLIGEWKRVRRENRQIR